MEKQSRFRTKIIIYLHSAPSPCRDAGDGNGMRRRDRGKRHGSLRLLGGDGGLSLVDLSVFSLALCAVRGEVTVLKGCVGHGIPFVRHRFCQALRVLEPPVQQDVW